MVEPAALVGRRPVGRAIAPPRVELFVVRARTCAARRTRDRPPARGSSFSTSIGVWLTTSSSALWLQTSCSSGAMLRSPTRIARPRPSARARTRPPSRRRRRACARIVVDAGIGLVAAGGHVEIMDFQPARLAAQRHRDMARVALVAEIARGSRRRTDGARRWRRRDSPSGR